MDSTSDKIDMKKLKETLKHHNQEHLLEKIDSLSGTSLSDYLSQIHTIDFKLSHQLYQSFLKKDDKSKELFKESDITDIKSYYKKDKLTSDQLHEFEKIGLDEIKNNRIALLILAGGQGSRLGFEKPKGMYNIKMPSGKSIFQYITERLLSIQNISRKDSSNLTSKESAVLLIMTSEENHKDTLTYFEQNNYFGYNKNDIIFFAQDTIPALDCEGKVIRKSINEIFKNPNGNGGCLIALKTNNILQMLQERKVKYIQVISVDNPLSKPLDPVYIGLTSCKNVQMAAKTINKREPNEPIGVFLKIKGVPYMIDYGDMPKSICEERDNNGNLKYDASNILNYLISVDLLSNILQNEEKYLTLIHDFHHAKKSIESYDSNDGQIKKISGIKFELFINSVFQYCETDFLLFGVDRNEEFAPVKNHPDTSKVDNPNTARELMTKLFKKWLERAGATVQLHGDHSMLEISFLKSYDGENFDEFKGKNVEVKDSLILK